MNLLSMIPYDIWITLGLIAIVAATVVGSRVGILPKKSIVYVATAIGGALAFNLLQRQLLKAELREFQAAKEEAERASKELDELKKQYRIDQQKRDQIIAEYEAKIAAHREKILMIEAKTEERKKEIDGMTREEQDALIAEFAARNSSGRQAKGALQ